MDGITFITEYTYDDAGKIRTITYPDGRIVTYNPDIAGQVLSVTYKTDAAATEQTLASAIDYEPFGPLKELTFGNGILLGQTFDLNYQFDNITAGTIQDLDYTPDSVGNITDITNTLDTTRDQVFDYDELYRLNDSTGIYSNINYVNDGDDLYVGYDNVGNRLFKTIDDQYLTAYTYELGSNKLTDVATDSDTITYTYDLNGNPASSIATTQGTSAVQIAYTYNPFGQRIKKVVDNGSTVETTLYHYDLYGNIIGETDENGNSLCAYIYLNGNLLPKIDGNPSSESVYYYHNDHLGTPQKMTDSTGTIVWAADYDPFGKATVTISTIENNMRLPGQYYDSETGLHYNYHRYYDPETGRYLTPDPIGLAGGINPYVYVLNNPINLIDPLGLLTEVVIWQPVGWGQSSFGHVSVNINGTTYSFSPSGMRSFDTDEYLSRNTFREGVGSELNLSECEEEELEEFLQNYQESYFFLTTNCTTPIQEGLEQLGHDLGINLFPVSLGYSIMESGLVNRYNFYEATTPGRGSSAPWAR